MRIDKSEIGSGEALVTSLGRTTIATHKAGDITDEELEFYRRYSLENLIHESRGVNGSYENVLGPTSESIEKLKSEYGLAEDAYWPLGEGPAEYSKLNDEYVIQAMFRAMYKYDLAADDAFLMWKEDESDDHAGGKLNAVIQTVDWFNWLEEDDEDDEEDYEEE